MLERLFKSRTTVRALALLLFGESFHLREISRRIRITPIYVKKELMNLRGLGLVAERRVGNLSVWSINRKSPLYEDLKRMFLKTECLGGYLREALGKFDIKYAMVFGSFANGSENERSDIDLLVVGDVDEDSIFTATQAAEKETGREINYILWRKKDFSLRLREKNHLLLEIARNPVVWLAGDEDGFRKAVKGRVH